MIQDGLRAAQVGLDRGRLVVAGQDGAAVQHGDLVDVDVHDPGVGAACWAIAWTLSMVGMPEPTSRNWRMPASPARKRTARPRNARFAAMVWRASGHRARNSAAATLSASKLCEPPRR